MNGSCFVDLGLERTMVGAALACSPEKRVYIPWESKPDPCRWRSNKLVSIDHTPLAEADDNLCILEKAGSEQTSLNVV